MADPNGRNPQSGNGGNGHERLLKGLLDSVNDLVWCTTIDGAKLLYVNPAAERIYGRPMTEMIENQDVWWDAIFPDDRPAVRKNLDELLLRGQIDQEYRIVRPDGEVRWLQDRIAVICDDCGVPVRVGGIGTDVSARKAAEQALSDSEAVYHSLVENLPLNVLRKDLDGRVAFGNQRYCETLNRTLPDLIGKTDFDLFPEELARKYVEDDRRVIEGGDLLHEVEEHHTQDGQRIFVEVFKSPVLNVEGEVAGVQVMFWDVTERKRAQEQLQAAKEAADAANRAKSDFLANMSHEIRTPMNAVIGMSELLLDTDLDPTQREYVRMVRESGESLLELINDILDFSKIEAGKFDLDSVPFSLQDSLGDTMKSLSIRAHRKDLELAFHIAPDVPDGLLGDPGRLQQVLINLVGNAVKFTERGEVVVRVQCVSREDDSALLRFSVIDTGIGIADEKLAHIFGAFHQADASTTRR
ncbi:MAG: PAS domain-containing protein, partial [Planctomycetaceae bacterium]